MSTIASQPKSTSKPTIKPPAPKPNSSKPTVGNFGSAGQAKMQSNISKSSGPSNPVDTFKRSEPRDQGDSGILDRKSFFANLQSNLGAPAQNPSNGNSSVETLKAETSPTPKSQATEPAKAPDGADKGQDVAAAKTGPVQDDPQRKEIMGLFDEWNAALKTKDPDKVTDLYAKDAQLLPTVSDRPRNTPEEIKDYFEHFLKNGPQGKIDESTARIRVNGDTASNSGIYEFTMANGDKVKARYTFNYKKVDGKWKIDHHHSSQMPEGGAKKPH